MTILLTIGLSSVPVEADSGRGPLRSLNELPLETLFLAWPLKDPDTIQPGHWKWTAAVALTNVIKHEVVDDSTEVFIDAEPLRLDFAAARGFGNGWEVEGQVTLFRLSGGFLDGFIRAFESGLGFPRRHGESALDDRFRYLIRRDGQTLIDLDGGSYGGLGDSTVLVKRRFRDRGNWSFAALAALKIPTGRKGLGSQGFDAGGGFTARYSRGRWRFRGELDLMALSDLDEIAASNRADFKLGFEYVRTRFSLYLQTDLRGRALTWGKDTLDERPFQVTVGGKFSKPTRVTHQMYIVEDLSRGSPDVTIGYGIEW